MPSTLTRRWRAAGRRRLPGARNRSERRAVHACGRGLRLGLLGRRRHFDAARLALVVDLDLDRLLVDLDRARRRHVHRLGAELRDDERRLDDALPEVLEVRAVDAVHLARGGADGGSAGDAAGAAVRAGAVEGGCGNGRCAGGAKIPLTRYRGVSGSGDDGRGGSGGSGSRTVKVYATSSATNSTTPASSARARGSGIGSRFKSAAPKALDRSMEKHA